MTVGRIDQDMAATAAGMLPDVADKELQSTLRTRYRQLRIMLHTAGLAATYAFIAAKATADSGTLAVAYREVAAGVSARLVRLGLLSDPHASHRDVLACLGSANPADYARASAEITMLAGWLSRLADAMYQPDTQLETPS